MPKYQVNDVIQIGQKIVQIIKIEPSINAYMVAASPRTDVAPYMEAFRVVDEYGVKLPGWPNQ